MNGATVLLTLLWIASGLWIEHFHPGLYTIHEKDFDKSKCKWFIFALQVLVGPVNLIRLIKFKK